MGGFLRTLFVLTGGLVLPVLGVFVSTGILAVAGRGRSASYWAWPFAVGLLLAWSFWVLLLFAMVQTAPDGR